MLVKLPKTTCLGVSSFANALSTTVQTFKLRLWREVKVVTHLTQLQNLVSLIDLSIISSAGFK